MAEGPLEAMADIESVLEASRDPMVSCGILFASKRVNEALKHLATLRRHLEPQPIESAPRDGTRVLLLASGFSGPDQPWEIGRWEDQKYNKRPNPYWRYDRWFDQTNVCREHAPTHWLPLPATANQEGRA